MERSEPIPVVLCAYSRPDHLRRTLECLKANHIPRIYAFSDGPRTPDAEAGVEAVRRLLRGIDWCETQITERPQNLGLGRSIRAAVGDVLDRHDSAIVFEDDLVCVPGTYAYLAAALRQYAGDERVMSVTGWTHPRITPPDVADAPYFDGRAECWVWGTWRRAWRGMDVDAAALMAMCERRGIDPYAYGADLVDMARSEHDRNIWAVRFLYHHIANGGLCLRPPYSMVEHIGFGAEATNTTDVASAWSNGELKCCPPIPERWPASVEHPECRRLAIDVYGGRPAESVRHRVRRVIRERSPRSLVAAYRRTKAAFGGRGVVMATTAVESPEDCAYGWDDPLVPARQRAAFAPLLEQMRLGRPRRDFVALADAVAFTECLDPLILEIGCSSAWNLEVLTHLRGRPVRYIGCDHSRAMTALAREHCPEALLTVGDGAALPFRSEMCDIVISGTVLMHELHYRRAIEESRRVTRRWCIFHTVPVSQRSPTLMLTKDAYGSRVAEVLISERELLKIFEQSGLVMHRRIENIRHEYLDSSAGEPITAWTYVCEKV